MNKETIRKGIIDSRVLRDKGMEDAYKTILSAIQEKENRDNVTLDESEIFKIIEREKNIFLESASLFKDTDKGDYYLGQAAILNNMLPEKVCVTEYYDIVSKYIELEEATSIKDMGKVMGALKKDFGIKLDFQRVSAIVKEKLS